MSRTTHRWNTVFRLRLGVRRVHIRVDWNIVSLLRRNSYLRSGGTGRLRVRWMTLRDLSISGYIFRILFHLLSLCILMMCCCVEIPCSRTCSSCFGRYQLVDKKFSIRADIPLVEVPGCLFSRSRSEISFLRQEVNSGSWKAVTSATARSTIVDLSSVLSRYPDTRGSYHLPLDFLHKLSVYHSLRHIL